MKYKNESNMPGYGDEITYPSCTNHPLDPRTPPDREDGPWSEKDWIEEEYNLDYEEDEL